MKFETEVVPMPLIPTISRQPLRLFLRVGVTVTLVSCASFRIQEPANNATIILPSPTKIVVTGPSYTGLKVTVDGADVSSQMNSTGSSDTGDVSLAAGAHTVIASADVQCWNCPGGKTHSTDSKSFIVSHGPQTCLRAGMPVITFSAADIAALQKPGRQLIGFKPNGTDGILIIVDDAPGLKPIEMKVELDIDPFNKVRWDKAIEAWGFCHLGSRVGLVIASLNLGSRDVETCPELTPANNFRSACVSTQTMLLNQSTTSELWLRKPGFAGIWEDIAVFDTTMWLAFGGRSVRFIWRFD